MKTLILIATLVLTAAVTIAQDDPKKEATKVVLTWKWLKDSMNASMIVPRISDT